MNGREWPEEHKQLLFSGRSNKEISEITGRTIKAVKSARYKKTGFYTEDRRPKSRTEIKSAENEARIIGLCKRIGVRIEGVHR